MIVVHGEGGHTSYNLVRTVANCLVEEKIPHNYYMVTNPEMIKNALVAKQLNRKYIYFAYDSEGLIAEGHGYNEARILDSKTPETIIVVSRIAYKFYKRMGFNTYLLRLGYDDYVYKKYDIERKRELGFIGTMDIVRDSVFYHRYVMCKDINSFMKQYIEGSDFLLTNNVPYLQLNKFYSGTILGLNDVIRDLNMRCFEIPSNGAFMLVNEQILECDYPLKPNTHYMVYSTTNHLMSIIKEILEDRDKVIGMGEKAQKVIMKYPISKNIKKMIDVLGLR